MKQLIRVNILVFAVVAALCVARPGVSAGEPFAQWLTKLRAEALAQGISSHTLDRAFADISPIKRVVELDRHQPEFVQTFWRYFETRVTPQRVRNGRQALQEHRALLERIHQHFGVEPEVIVAFWGLETNYGGNTGPFRAASALATLAYDGRRAVFFRKELLALLALMEGGDVPVDASSSWAGALGHMQFMPSTYMAYAVDFDGDGRRDLWNSLNDAFASAANYLSSMGWDTAVPWGREVRLPQSFDYYLSGTDTTLSASGWHRLGVRAVDGLELSQQVHVGSIILPGGAKQGPALLVYENFQAILRWNRSVFYAVAVGSLSDQIAGAGPFAVRRNFDEPVLARMDILEMQSRLEALGYDTGGVDGIVGARTRNAIRGFQKSQSIPADGHPSVTVLQELRTKGGGAAIPQRYEHSDAQKVSDG